MLPNRGSPCDFLFFIFYLKLIVNLKFYKKVKGTFNHFQCLKTNRSGTLHQIESF